MPFCRKCGKELTEGSIFCSGCGERQEPVAPPAAQPDDFEQNLVAFIGPNVHKYLPKFRKFNVAGIDDFQATWHWPAFLASFCWFLYRKMYLWAVLNFISMCIPYVNFILWFVWTIAANYLYYKHAKKRIQEIRSVRPTGDITSVLSQIGGVNQWLWTVGIIFSIIAVIVLLVCFGLFLVVARHRNCFQ